MQTTQTSGFYSKYQSDGIAVGTVIAMYTKDNSATTLSLNFNDSVQITAEFSKVEALIKDIRKRIKGHSFKEVDDFIEDFVETKGIYTDKNTSNMEDSVIVFFRTNGDREMLTYEVTSKCEISVDFEAVGKLVRV